MPPVFLEEEIPATDNAYAFMNDAGRQICEILRGNKSRIIVVVGPCSIHDVAVARDYAGRLRSAARELSGELFVVM